MVWNAVKIFYPKSWFWIFYLGPNNYSVLWFIIRSVWISFFGFV